MGNGWVWQKCHVFMLLGRPTDILILAYSWARPALLEAGKGVGGGCFCYAPNFKEVRGAYCFWVVRPSVRSSRFLMHSITLKP